MMTEVDLEANAVSDALLPPGPQLSHRMARRQFGVATESPTSVHIELELLTTETLQHPGVSKKLSGHVHDGTWADLVSSRTICSK